MRRARDVSSRVAIAALARLASRRINALRHDTLLQREIGWHIVAGGGFAQRVCPAIMGQRRAGYVRLRAAALALSAVGQAGALARAHHDAPAKIRQGERRAPVAAIHCAEQGEEGGILGNRQQAAIGLPNYWYPVMFSVQLGKRPKPYFLHPKRPGAGRIKRIFEKWEAKS